MSRFEDHKNPDERKRVGEPTQSRSQTNSSDAAGGSADRIPDSRATDVAERHVYPFRDRDVRLNERQVATLRAIGAFRTVRAQDVVEGIYRGDETAFQRDQRRLESGRLVASFKRRGRPQEHFLNLTLDGKELTERRLRPVSNQAIYAGMQKLQELDHDAALYKMYLKASERIEAEGGRPVRIILDEELKKGLNRKLDAIQKLPRSEQRRALESLAAEHELKVIDDKIPIPDVRVEYERRDGERAHLDLEYVTEHYRADAIAEKARAGFSLYASPGFARSSGGAAGRRVKRQFPSLAAEILSL